LKLSPTNRLGETPLHLAAVRGNYEVTLFVFYNYNFSSTHFLHYKGEFSKGQKVSPRDNLSMFYEQLLS
jgi:hypothetical protein